MLADAQASSRKDAMGALAAECKTLHCTLQHSVHCCWGDRLASLLSIGGANPLLAAGEKGTTVFSIISCS